MAFKPKWFQRKPPDPTSLQVHWYPERRNWPERAPLVPVPRTGLVAVWAEH